MQPSRYFVRRLGPPTAIETEASPVFIDETEPVVDLLGYWRVLRKHIRLILCLLFGVITVTALHLLTVTPIYTAEATILIQPNAQQSSDTLENLVELETAAVNSDQYYRTQCEMLQSRNLAASVIRTVGLEHNPAFTGPAPMPGILSRLFSAVTTPLAASGKNAARPNEPASSDAEIGSVPAQLVHGYLGELTVSPVKDTNLVKVAFQTPNARLSAELANAHIAGYRHQQIELRGKTNEEAQRFLQAKLISIKEQLEKSEAALNDYRRQKGIIPGLISLDGKDAVVLDRLSDLSKDLTKAQVDRIGLEAQEQLIRKHDYASLPQVTGSATIQATDKELNGLYAQNAALSSQFRPDYPPLAKLRAQIHELQGRVNQESNKVVAGIQSEYEEAVEKEAKLQQEMNRQRAETLALNDSAAQYAILQRDVDTNRQLYNAVLTRLKDISLEGDIQATNVSVINSAEVPSTPTYPRKLHDLALATVVGLAGGIGLAFLLEFLDNTLKNPEEAENYLRLPSLGVVPEFSSIDGKSAYSPRQLKNGPCSTVLPPGRELVTSHGSYSSIGEAYRSLRTALLMSQAGGPPKVVLITSAMSQEGKTVTSVNIAVMLSQLGGGVLLIDGDLRRARCHRVLAVDNHLGLTEVLTGTRDVYEMIRPTEIENLYFLGSGSVPPNPTELLGSPKMGETLASLREHYEYVVVDSPPVLPVSDSLLLGKLTDGVVLIANGSATPRQQVRAACARLEYANAKILGVVLNKVKIHSADYHYYYHNEYYSFESDLPQDEEEPS